MPDYPVEWADDLNREDPRFPQKKTLCVVCDGTGRVMHGCDCNTCDGNGWVAPKVHLWAY